MWKLLYPRWRSVSQDHLPGYTLFLPVPGDLPVFLKIAVDISSRQNLKNLVETLVIPDKVTPAFLKTFEESQIKWPEGNLRLVSMSGTQNLIIKLTNNPGHIAWLQLINAVNKTRTAHALLHDADAFIANRGFFGALYRTCLEKNLSCVGVNKVWDSWFAENGYKHLAATWELMFSLEWMRKFPPWQHHGQTFSVHGVNHVCDTTLWPQCQTSPEKITLIPFSNGEFVHFNYVISTYRFFQREKKRPYVDEHFRLLLIRLLEDLYLDSSQSEIPSLSELTASLKQGQGSVVYNTPDIKNNYYIFRQKFEELLHFNLFTNEQSSALREKIEPFDAHFDRHVYQ